MRKIFSFTLVLLFYGTVNSQIAELKVDGNLVKIYNDNADYTGKNIYLCSNCEVVCYNDKYIIIRDGNMAKIYDYEGTYTGYYIYLCQNCYIKNVVSSVILVKDGNIVKYYDFKGSYTGKFTLD